MTGKIVAVNTAHQTITVDVKGAVFDFLLSPQAFVTRQGQSASLDSLVPGEQVSLVARRDQYSRFEVVSVEVLGVPPPSVRESPPAKAPASPPAQVTARPAPAPTGALTGKIVALDQGRQAITVDMQGGKFDFWLNPQAVITVRGQPASIDTLGPGQEISLVARRDQYGRFEVESLSVGGLPPTSVSEAPSLKMPKLTKHEVSASGDFFYGQGTVTLPIGFSLVETLTKNFGPGVLGGFKPVVAAPSRKSDYLGATVSYSYKQAWYVDVSYAHGSSSGTTDIDTGAGTLVPATFTMDDDWYQAYLRYTFPGLRGKPLFAYLRAGASYVEAKLFAGDTALPPFGTYTQTDKTKDILGNLGFGIGYRVYKNKSGTAKLFLQVEGEAFYGSRSQESLEILPKTQGVTFETVKIDNTLYGGIGRGAAHFEYSLGGSGLFRVFADGGLEAKYTLIHYSGASAPNELLWGPYVKVGLLYAF